MVFYISFAIIISIFINVAAININDDGGVLSRIGVTIDSDGKFDFNYSLFVGSVLTLIGASAIVGIGVGFLSQGSITPQDVAIQSFIIATLAVFVGSIASILTATSGFPNFVAIPMAIVMIPFTVGYIVTMLEYFRGNV
jgi:hypothetical protein